MGGSAYRGFLFADMRGFTAFAERHGNAAAAEMVGRFLEIARKAIELHQGSEIGTEGDAIHAVFESASGAVLCGLDIVDGAAELSAREPDRPLGLGVGIHAGEAVSTNEGYIGRAVNIAARLCAGAKAGEVLVSSTVKGITQASIQVGFIPKGRRRLKGIQDPILVYAVSRDLNARAPSRVTRPAVLGAAAVVALVAIVAIGASVLLPKIAGNAGASPSVSVPPTAQPIAMGPLAIGSYAPRVFQPPFTFDVPDPGWAAFRDTPGLFGLVREQAPRGTLYFGRVQEVIADPCIQGGDVASAPPADVIAELQALAHLEVSDVEPTQLGGAAGRQAKVTVSEGAQAACGGLVGAGVGVFVAGGEVWQAAPGELFKVISVTVRGDPVTVLLSLDWTQTHSVQEVQDMFQLGGSILNTVDF